MKQISYFLQTSDDCTLNVSSDDNSFTFNYPCKSSFDQNCKPYEVILQRGKYFFELWGASGGNARHQNQKTIRADSGGKGAYVSGFISFDKLFRCYLYIGGQGEDQSSNSAKSYGRGGFNGGGDGGSDLYDYDSPESSAGGGGGTDIRLLNAEVSEIESLKSRIIVAGGGGRAVSNNESVCSLTNDIMSHYLCTNDGYNALTFYGGHAGALEGYSYNSVTHYGTQNSLSFGKGENGLSFDLSISPSGESITGGSTGGGGGGYYG